MALTRCPGVDGQRCGILTEHRHCPDHKRVVQLRALHRKRTIRPYTAAERERRAKAVADWIAEHGETCPGWRREAHPLDTWTGPLTADHLTPVARGGHESGPLTVLCRHCNSRRGTQVD